MISKLVMLNKACKGGGVELKFCEVSPNVMEVFKITKLHKVFDIKDTEDKAAASFGKKGMVWVTPKLIFVSEVESYSSLYRMRDDFFRRFI